MCAAMLIAASIADNCLEVSNSKFWGMWERGGSTADYINQDLESRSRLKP